MLALKGESIGLARPQVGRHQADIVATSRVGRFDWSHRGQTWVTRQG